jgi:hypothetical protein
MTIAVTCPHCQARLTLKDEFAGRRGACPKCKGAIQVPAARQSAPLAQPPAAASGVDDPIRVSCPQCGKVLQGRASMAGKRVKCPACSQVLVLPGGQEEAAAMQPAVHQPLAEQPQSSWFDQAMDDYVIAKPSGSREPVVHAANPYLAPANVGGGAALKRSRSSGDSDLTLFDWMIVVFFGGIACILGIIWMIQGNPKGGKMILAVLMVGVAWVVFVFVLAAVVILTH